jgi:sulfide dehydrogenase cytochrome subunit
MVKKRRMLMRPLVEKEFIMHCLIRTAFPLALLALSQVVAAETVVPGRLLASNCFQCHGTDGRPVAGLANLAGESVSSLYYKMLELRQKTKEDSIMNSHVRGYTDQQLWELSVYFSQLPH